MFLNSNHYKRHNNLWKYLFYFIYVLFLLVFHFITLLWAISRGLPRRLFGDWKAKVKRPRGSYSWLHSLFAYEHNYLNLHRAWTEIKSKNRAPDSTLDKPSWKIRGLGSWLTIIDPFLYLNIITFFLRLNFAFKFCFCVWRVKKS